MLFGVQGIPRDVRQFTFDGWVEPADVFCEVFSSQDKLVWLDSAAHPSRFSYLALGDETLFGWTAEECETLLVSLRNRLRESGVIDSVTDSFAGPFIEFNLGWVGWLGYDAVVSKEKSSRYPRAVFMWVTRMLVFDHHLATVKLVTWNDSFAAQWLQGMIASLEKIKNREDIKNCWGKTSKSKREREEVSTIRGGVFHSRDELKIQWRHSNEQYRDLIRKCQQFIDRGEAYQLCLTNEITVSDPIDPVSTYLRLRTTNPSHHGGFLRVGDVSLLSSSPEQFLYAHPNGRIVTKPIKGTRPRGRGLSEDEHLCDELRGSVKERAENVMIVDLMRNDFSRVAEPGSVCVEELCAVETYSHVHQLVSTVSAQLASGCDVLDVLAASFPPGSMTGAPKTNAMKILDELENSNRGIYSGIFGFLGVNGSADFAVVIRSIVIDRAGASIGTGGGITALSDPDEEVQEIKLKAAVLLDALHPVRMETG